MTAAMSRARRFAGQLVAALRGHGRLEHKLILVGAVGGALFVTLVATLFLVQHQLGAVQRRLVERAMPAEQQVARLEASIGAAFGRQAQVSSTTSPAQLEPLRDRSAVEPPLRQAAGALAQLPEAAELAGNVEQFLASDRALYSAVERRHQLQATFELELNRIDGDLRALVEDSQAVSGLLRLEYVLVLRGIAASLTAGALRSDLVRTAVLGDVRAALDDTAELANAVLMLGHVTGKLGLAASSDAINSLVANELPQIRARIDQRIASLGRSVDHRPEVRARTTALAQRFGDIAPRIMDEKRAGSLVELRRRAVAEAAAAVQIRADSVTAAARLTADAAALHKAIAVQVEASVHDSAVASASARLVSLVIAVLGLLGCAFAGRRIAGGIDELETTNDHLIELKGNLESLNASLEDKVTARTQALVARDRAMQRVLDSMHEGLATVSLDGTLRPERSKAFTAWFGDPGDQPVWQVLYPGDPERCASYALGFQQLAEDVMPFELTVDQMASRIERGDRSFELELRAVHEAGVLDAVLLVVRDVTDQLAGLRAARAAHEEHRIITNLLRDRRGFLRSIEELDRLISTVRTTDDPALRARALHTVKGNAAVLGFTALASRADELEDELEREGQITAGSLTALDRGFKDSLERIRELSADARDRLDIDASDYGRLIEQLQRRAAHDDILGLVESWQREPVDNILNELASHARRLAEHSGKRVNVVVEGNGIRVVDEGLRAFFRSLVHGVRNAIDHGIEPPELRVAHGKPDTATIKLSVAFGEAGALIVSVSDDGTGVDLERVRERARGLGLPHDTGAELLDALFADGLTTRDHVTDLSGRGIGTSAVRASCRELGGEAHMISEWGRGSELRCVLPASAITASRSSEAA
jgi:HPt (histidine-containing phosphotransfer) domain-containing protein